MNAITIVKTKKGFIVFDAESSKIPEDPAKIKACAVIGSQSCPGTLSNYLSEWAIDCTTELEKDK